MKLPYKYLIAILILSSMLLIINLKSAKNPPDTFKSLMNSRTSLIASYCERNDFVESEGKINYQSIFIQKDFDFMWCPIFKASSTTWINYLMDLKVEKVKIVLGNLLLYLK